MLKQHKIATRLNYYSSMKTPLEELRSRRRNQAHNTGVKIINVVGGDLHHESGGPVTLDVGHELDRVLCLGHTHPFVYCRVEKHLLGTKARVNTGNTDRSLTGPRAMSLQTRLGVVTCTWATLTLPISFRRTIRRLSLVVCFIRRNMPTPMSPHAFSLVLKRNSLARKWPITCSGSTHGSRSESPTGTTTV